MQTILKLLKAFGPITIGPNSVTVYDPKSFNIQKLKEACAQEGLKVQLEEGSRTEDPFIRVQRLPIATDEAVIAKMGTLKQ